MKSYKFNFLISFVFIFLLNFNIYAEDKVVLIATTSSAENTGLLEYLSPIFTKDTGIKLKWVVTGSGKAFELGKRCDVDGLLVHAPKLEKQYIEDKFSLKRNKIMFNHFILVGPSMDPANIRGKSIEIALKSIIESGSIFVSRGDFSGTHIYEISLWEAANLNIPESGKGYIQSGQGMLATLNLTKELGGYTIVDIGTYMKYIDNFAYIESLEVILEYINEVKNQYSLLLVNSENCPKCNFEAASIFLNWITSFEGQNHIRNFTLNGKQLFFPNAN